MSDAYSPIPQLNLLKEFEDQHRYVSDGFELYAYGRPDAGLVEWFDLRDTQDPDRLRFLARLVPFAQASASGSFYALWRCDDREHLATLPVIRFGDEGDLDVVASGLSDLLRLLAIDHEWYLDGDEDEDGDGDGDGDGGEGEDEDEGRDGGNAAYLAWLQENFGLTRPADPGVILKAAMDEHGQRFADWLRQFVEDDIADAVLEPSDILPDK